MSWVSRPMIVRLEAIGGVDANPPDLDALADQHARTARPAHAGNRERRWMEIEMKRSDVLIIGAGPTGLVLL